MVFNLSLPRERACGCVPRFVDDELDSCKHLQVLLNHTLTSASIRDSFPRDGETSRLQPRSSTDLNRPALDISVPVSQSDLSLSLDSRDP